MKDGIFVTQELQIPLHEVDLTASRAGGPGGQHVNKTSSRITARWNIKASSAITEEQRVRLLEKLGSQLSKEGDLIIHSSASRSQQHNKKSAIDLLAKRVRNALHVPKKRMKSRIPKGAKEARLHKKKQRSEIKKMRGKLFD